MNRNAPRMKSNSKSGSLDHPGLITVLIADDHVTVREGLAAIIGRQQDMLVVGEATHGREAVELWEKHRPRITLLDLRMPELDGLGALQQIRDLDANARVIVLTTFDSGLDIQQAIRSGARAYLLKDSQREDLLSCIRKVDRGETSFPQSVIQKLTMSMGGDPLTQREIEVLGLLAEGKSNKEIGSQLNIGETTVKTHLRNIFAKLNVLSRTEAISTASKRGLIHI